MAAQLLGSGRLPSRAAAGEAMAAYAELVAAAGSVWRALWAGPVAPPPPAARLGRCLSTRPPRPAPGAASTAVATLWRSAAVSVRSAADLLATHRTPGGRWRSPESTALAGSDLLVAGSGRLAEVLLTVLAAGPDLLEQLGTHGIGAAATRRGLGGLTTLRVAARGCALVAPPLPTELATLGLARPTVARDLSVSALADRMTRVRRTAWELSTSSRVPVTSLAAIAGCAVDLCDYADSRAGRVLPWRRLRRGLAELRTLTPPAPTLQADTAAVRWLLRSGVPTGTARPVVDAAIDRLPELARWGAAAFSRVPTADLYVLGTALRGDEVSEHPDLVRAKLAGRVVLAPCNRIAAVAAAYAAAAQV